MAVCGDSPCFEQRSSIFKTDGVTEKVNKTRFFNIDDPKMICDPSLYL